MKIKIFLLGIFSLLALSGYAQAEKNEVTEPEDAVTSFSIKTDSLDELINFDWGKVKETLNENDKDQEITLSFLYENNTDRDTSSARLKDFKFKVTGKTSELKKLTTELNRMLKKLA